MEMFAIPVKQPLQILVQLRMFCTRAPKECKMDVGINMSATNELHPLLQLGARSVHTLGLDHC